MVEIDAFARQTFLANHAVNRVYKDVTTLDPSTLESVDIFVFGLFVAMICFLAFLKVQATKEHKDTNLDKENQ